MSSVHDSNLQWCLFALQRAPPHTSALAPAVHAAQQGDEGDGAVHSGACCGSAGKRSCREALTAAARQQRGFDSMLVKHSCMVPTGSFWQHAAIPTDYTVATLHGINNY